MSELERLMEREIPQEDITQLRTLMRLADDVGEGGEGDLPFELRQCYWQWKIGHDRIDGSGLSTMDFKIIGMFAGVYHMTPEDNRPKNFLEAVLAGEVKAGAAVSFKFRRQHVAGHFQSLSKDRRHANVVDVEGKDRAVIVADVFVDPKGKPADLTPASAKQAEEDAAPPEVKPARNRGGRPSNAERAAREQQTRQPVAAASRPDIHQGGDANTDDDV